MEYKDTLFKPGHKKTGGRKKGTPNKIFSLRKMLDEWIARNHDKIEQKLDEMVDNRHDFRWLLQVRAGLEPKEFQHSGNVGNLSVMVIENGNGKASNIQLDRTANNRLAVIEKS